MRLTTTICSGAVVLMAIGATVTAQDTTVKSRTDIKADEAQVVSMTGCLRQDASTGAYTLAGTVDAAGERVRTEAKVTVDRDKDDTTVTADTRARADNGDEGAVGVKSVYVLSPGNVNLTPYVGKQVQIAAAAVKPGHKDADVTITDKTTVDQEHGRDQTERSKTKVEIERGPIGQYTVVSLKQLSGTCA